MMNPPIAAMNLSAGFSALETHESSQLKKVAAPLLCFMLSFLMHLPWLGASPIGGTEGHRIFPAHDMVRTGWLLVPMLFGKPFLTKPPLHHWLIALSEVICGRGNVFVWRIAIGPRRRGALLRCLPVRRALVRQNRRADFRIMRGGDDRNLGPIASGRH